MEFCGSPLDYETHGSWIREHDVAVLRDVGRLPEFAEKFGRGGHVPHFTGYLSGLILPVAPSALYFKFLVFVLCLFCLFVLFLFI